MHHLYQTLIKERAIICTLFLIVPLLITFSLNRHPKKSKWYRAKLWYLLIFYGLMLLFSLSIAVLSCFLLVKLPQIPGFLILTVALLSCIISSCRFWAVLSMLKKSKKRLDS